MFRKQLNDSKTKYESETFSNEGIKMKNIRGLTTDLSVARKNAEERGRAEGR